MAALIDNFTVEELKDIVANSHNYKEVLIKIGYKTTGGNARAILKSRIDLYGIDISHFTTVSNNTKRNEENIFIENSTASQATLRRWYVKGKYTEYKCSICGMESVWQGKELTLILDHINGINNDDRLENLRWVCPNCNQQLDTTGFSKKQSEKYKQMKINTAQQSYPILKNSLNYCVDCGKNISRGGTRCIECAAKLKRSCERPDRETLKKLIREKSFLQIGQMYSLTDNSIRKWCKKYNLPHLKSVINNYTDEEWLNI